LDSNCVSFGIDIFNRSRRKTYGWDEEALDFVNCTLKLELRAYFRVLDGEQDVEIVLQVLPVGFASVLVLLKPDKSNRCYRTR
jgi:hypothetical protein